MSGTQSVGMALDSADTLLKTITNVQGMLEGRKTKQKLRTLVSASENLVQRMRESINQYSNGYPEDAIPGTILKRAKVEFDDVNKEFESLFNTRCFIFKMCNRAKKVRRCNETLRSLESHLTECRLLVHGRRPLRDSTMELAEETRNLKKSKDTMNSPSVQKSICEIENPSENNSGDVNIAPEQDRDRFNVLSKSAEPEDKKKHVADEYIQENKIENVESATQKEEDQLNTLPKRVDPDDQEQKGVHDCTSGKNIKGVDTDPEQERLSKSVDIEDKVHGLITDCTYDGHIPPEQTKNIINLLSNSGLSNEKHVTQSAAKKRSNEGETDIEQEKDTVNPLSKSEDRGQDLVEMMRKLSTEYLHATSNLHVNDWKVNPLDFEFVRKPDGDRKRIGSGATGHVYLAHMKLYNENGDVIPGEHMEVAIKEFNVKRSEEMEKCMKFVREVALQQGAKHPCVLHTLGGYWPDSECADAGYELQPYIVMERMSHNLRQAIEEKLLETLEVKLCILLDILAGIAHIRSLSIQHRDIKPEKVLVRVVDGKIVGRAKVFDFCEKAQTTKILDEKHQTYEEIVNVLMCEVLYPDFLTNLAREHRDLVLTGSSGFSEKIYGSARETSSNVALGNILACCLCGDPHMRPRLQDVFSRILKVVRNLS